MATLHVLRGLPGSGKSTKAKAWVAEDSSKRVRVNRDAIRWTQGIRSGVGTKEQERLVTAIERASVKGGLEAGYDVIVDATNLNAQFVKEWFKFNFPVEFVDLNVPIEECIRRDAERERNVGADVIRSLAKRYGVAEDGTLPDAPIQEEPPAFTLAPPWDRYKQNAIIVDIDGTLANHKGIRSPYDTSRYHLDTVHREVRHIVNSLESEYYVIVTTGRSADFRGATEAWLKDNAIRFDELVMRKSGDNRNDSIVKHDLFHEHIAPKYNVIMAFDDRDRVVKAWRDMGIKTAQVAYGDF